MSPIGPFETCQRPRKGLLLEEDRKLSTGGRDDANDPSRTFGSSILPTAIGRGRIDRFSSCGLGLSPSGLAQAAGLVQHAGCFAASTHCTILQLDINLVT